MMNYLNENIDDVRFVVETSRIYAEFDEKVAARKFHFTLSNSYQTYTFAVFVDICRDLTNTASGINLNES